MADSSTDDFLEIPPDATPAYAGNTSLARRSRRMPAVVTTGAWVAAGLVAGAIGVAALHSTGSANTANGTPAAVTNQLPAAAPQQGLTGGPPGGGGSFPGRLAGERHVVGTLTAVGSSGITVQSATGTATYPIEASTLLVKDGQRVASVSSLTVGDTVVVHVYPQNGTAHVELVIDSGGTTRT